MGSKSLRFKYSALTANLTTSFSPEGLPIDFKRCVGTRELHNLKFSFQAH